jgi:hypothetical protein
MKTTKSATDQADLIERINVQSIEKQLSRLRERVEAGELPGADARWHCTSTGNQDSASIHS